MIRLVNSVGTKKDGLKKETAVKRVLLELQAVILRRWQEEPDLGDT